MQRVGIYIQTHSHNFKYIYVVYVWKKTKRKTEVHTLKYICKHTYVCVKVNVFLKFHAI